MAAVAVSVDSRDCKTAGCGGEAMHARGPYAGLCLACTATQRRRLSLIQREAASKMTPEQRSARASAGGAVKVAGTGKTTTLRDVTRRLEQAAAHLEKARVAEQGAMAAARKARDARVAAEALILELRRELDVALGVAAGAPT